MREGPDLSLVGSDGAEVLVVNFFAVAEPPALVGDTGLKILPQVAEKLAGPMAPGQYAQAAPGVAGEPVARVETIDGDAFAVRADGTRVALTAARRCSRATSWRPARAPRSGSSMSMA